MTRVRRLPPGSRFNCGAQSPIAGSTSYEQPAQRRMCRICVTFLSRSRRSFNSPPAQESNCDTSADETSLKMLRTAFDQHPMPDISLVDLRHADDRTRWPTLCILESQPTGDRLNPYEFMIDRPQHGLCSKLIVPNPYRRIWDCCSSGMRPRDIA